MSAQRRASSILLLALLVACCPILAAAQPVCATGDGAGNCCVRFATNATSLGGCQRTAQMYFAAPLQRKNVTFPETRFEPVEGQNLSFFQATQVNITNGGDCVANLDLNCLALTSLLGIEAACTEDLVPKFVCQAIARSNELSTTDREYVGGPLGMARFGIGAFPARAPQGCSCRPRPDTYTSRHAGNFTCQYLPNSRHCSLVRGCYWTGNSDNDLGTCKAAPNLPNDTFQCKRLASQIECNTVGCLWRCDVPQVLADGSALLRDVSAPPPPDLSQETAASIRSRAEDARRICQSQSSNTPLAQAFKTWMLESKGLSSSQLTYSRADLNAAADRAADSFCRIEFLALPQAAAQFGQLKGSTQVGMAFAYGPAFEQLWDSAFGSSQARVRFPATRLASMVYETDSYKAQLLRTNFDFLGFRARPRQGSTLMPIYCTTGSVPGNEQVTPALERLVETEGVVYRSVDAASSIRCYLQWKPIQLNGSGPNNTAGAVPQVLAADETASVLAAFGVGNTSASNAATGAYAYLPGVPGIDVEEASLADFTTFTGQTALAAPLDQGATSLKAFGIVPERLPTTPCSQNGLFLDRDPLLSYSSAIPFIVKQQIGRYCVLSSRNNTYNLDFNASEAFSGTAFYREYPGAETYANPHLCQGATALIIRDSRTLVFGNAVALPNRDERIYAENSTGSSCGDLIACYTAFFCGNTTIGLENGLQVTVYSKNYDSSDLDYEREKNQFNGGGWPFVLEEPGDGVICNPQEAALDAVAGCLTGCLADMSAAEDLLQGFSPSTTCNATTVKKFMTDRDAIFSLYDNVCDYVFATYGYDFAESTYNFQNPGVRDSDFQQAGLFSSTGDDNVTVPIWPSFSDPTSFCQKASGAVCGQFRGPYCYRETYSAAFPANKSYSLDQAVPPTNLDRALPGVNQNMADLYAAHPFAGSVQEVSNKIREMLLTAGTIYPEVGLATIGLASASTIGTLLAFRAARGMEVAAAVVKHLPIRKAGAHKAAIVLALGAVLCCVLTAIVPNVLMIYQDAQANGQRYVTTSTSTSETALENTDRLLLDTARPTGVTTLSSLTVLIEYKTTYHTAVLVVASLNIAASTLFGMISSIMVLRT